MVLLTSRRQQRCASASVSFWFMNFPLQQARVTTMKDTAVVIKSGLINLEALYILGVGLTV